MWVVLPRISSLMLRLFELAVEGRLHRVSSEGQGAHGLCTLRANVHGPCRNCGGASSEPGRCTDGVQRIVFMRGKISPRGKTFSRATALDTDAPRLHQEMAVITSFLAPHTRPHQNAPGLRSGFAKAEHFSYPKGPLRSSGRRSASLGMSRLKTSDSSQLPCGLGRTSRLNARRTFRPAAPYSQGLANHTSHDRVLARADGRSP